MCECCTTKIKNGSLQPIPVCETLTTYQKGKIYHMLHVHISDHSIFKGVHILGSLFLTFYHTQIFTICYSDIQPQSGFDDYMKCKNLLRCREDIMCVFNN